MSALSDIFRELNLRYIIRVIIGICCMRMVEIAAISSRDSECRTLCPEYIFPDTGLPGKCHPGHTPTRTNTPYHLIRTLTAHRNP